MWKPLASLRAALAFLGIFGAIFFPVWMPVAAIFILSALWRSWEALLIGLFLDFLWAPPHAMPYFTLGAIAVVWAFEPLRARFLPQ